MLPPSYLSMHRHHQSRIMMNRGSISHCREVTRDNDQAEKVRSKAQVPPIHNWTTHL